MAKYVISFLFLSLIGQSYAASSVCTDAPSAELKNVLCKGEDHPIATKLCLDTIEVKRDRYGRVAEYSYKKDARVPSMEILEAACGGIKFEADCRRSLRLEVDLEGRPYSGIIETADGKTIDFKFSDDDPIVQGSGEALCDHERAGTLDRQHCIDNIDLEAEGDFITTFKLSSISNYASDEDVLGICDQYKEKGTKAFEHCRATAQVVKDPKGGVLSVKYDDEIPANFQPLKPICDEEFEKAVAEQNAPKAAPTPKKISPKPAVTKRVPTSTPSSTLSLNTQKKKCSGLKGAALESCMKGLTGENLSFSFDNCKAAWSERSTKSKIGERPAKRPGSRPSSGVTAQ